jgi:transcriptional regulator with XRE-family HTH domain
MSKRPKNHLKAIRRLTKLSQQDVADLLNNKNDNSTMSRLESGEREPTLRQLLCLTIIYGVSASALFPDYYDALEEEIMRNAVELIERVEARTSELAKAKRQFLYAMAKRISNAGRI